MKKASLVLWFNELSIGDVPIVGGKNASLGEMYRELKKKKVNIPNGFAITAEAYRFLLKSNNAEKKVKSILKGLNTKNLRNLKTKGNQVRTLIRNLAFPEKLKEDIAKAYKKLEKEYGKNCDTAVRSSATAEDLPDASFAGQQETFLNIRGINNLLEACKHCFASLFTNRAISYREDKGFDHFKVALSIGVQKMVRSDLASSGVMFSIDTESGFRNAAFITAAYGLGETVVQGAVNPDEYYVFKPTLNKFKPIIKKKVGEKKIKMIYSSDSSKPTKTVSVNKAERKKFVLTEPELLTLAKWACIIEDHYSNKRKCYTPMDMEWAKDGKTNKLFIVQARPETVTSQRDVNTLEEYHLTRTGSVIITGSSVGERIGKGKARIIKDVKDIHKFKKGEVLVTDMTDPDWEPIMKIASAIVTNRGGRTCFSGNTKILTNEGFKTMEQVFKNHEGLKVPSLNKETLKIEWKSILASMKKTSEIIEINSSQTGNMKNNCLRLTPDHKMLTFENEELISKKIKNILNQDEMLLVAQNLPALTTSTLKENHLAYLLGAISTDGNIYETTTNGEVSFIQKPTKEKEKFIQHVNFCLNKTFKKEFKTCIKKTSSGMIRGQSAIGNANHYRCYSKLIAQEFGLEQEQLTETLLVSDTKICLNFLGGVIDGDGCFKNNRVHIYISKQNLLENVIVGLLRLGIVPQITNNRNIAHVQIVEKINLLLKHTKRVKGTSTRINNSRFFSAKQLFKNLNVKGDFKNRKDKNLLIGASSLPKRFNKLLNSDTRMIRTSFNRHLGIDFVYNITVEDNHNYIVFTDRYTPLLVNNCHAAIISRELGIPCIVGTNHATEAIKNKQKITISCAEGEIGFVYKGDLPFKIKKTNLKTIPKTKTKIMMNVGNPDEAFNFSFIPNDGVGLAREEFIINSYIKIHPMALIHFNKIKDKKERDIINKLTHNYNDKKQFFIDELARGVGTIAAAFYPKDVIVRLSDFKTNEYASLIGGKQFEPKEDNPMIGWRGASRYYKPGYKEAFILECKAMKKAREEFGLNNIKLMVPFCRTITEGKKVIKIMQQNGLKQGKNNLELYVMCEVPSNVILADEFAKIFDGFSIGSNDLTQLTLGVDRDSAILSDVYDEQNQAVKDMISIAITHAKKNKRKIGICGQAPSDFPEFAQFLVKQNIDSISLNPDTVLKTRLKIAEAEKK